MRWYFIIIGLVFISNVYAYSTIDLLNPVTLEGDGYLAVQNSTFNVSSNISCLATDCNITITLYESINSFLTIIESASGTAEYEDGNAVAQLINGDFIVGGTTNERGGTDDDILAARFNSTGGLVWFKYLGGASNDRVDTIGATPDGGFVLGGTTESWDTTDEGFVMKFNSSGNEQWTMLPNASGYNDVDDLFVDSDGNIIISGQTSELNGSYTNILTYKLNSSGNMQWYSTSMGYASHTRNPYIQEISSGGFVTAGFTQEYGGDHDTLLLKYYDNGSIEWSRYTDVTTFDTAQGITETSSGDLITIGYYGTTLNLYDVMIQKFNSTGNEQWTKTFGDSSLADAGRAIIPTDDNGVIITGYHQDTNNDTFLIKINSTGDLVWGKIWNTTGNEYPDDMIRAEDGGIVIVGGTATYNGTDSDLFILKVGPDGEFPGLVNWTDFTPTLTDRAETETITSENVTFHSKITTDEGVTETDTNVVDVLMFNFPYSSLYHFTTSDANPQYANLSQNEYQIIYWDLNASGNVGNYTLYINTTVQSGGSNVTNFDVNITPFTNSVPSPPVLAIYTNGTNGSLSNEDIVINITNSTDSDGQTVYNITDWRVDGVSIAPGNWPFDENVANTTTGAIKDFSTYGYNLTLGGGSSARSPTFTTDCQIGGCYSFDGNDQYIANNITNFQENDTVGTVEAWIYLNSVAKSQYIWKVYDKTNSDSVMSLAFHDTGDALYVWKQNSTFDGIGARSNTAISVSTWTHVVGQYDGTDFVFYVNGVETGYSIASVGGGWLDTIGTTDTVLVGAHTAGVDTLEFDGKIDELRYYDRVLTPEQIYQNYRAGLEGHHNYNISYSETNSGETWTVAVTPTDLVDVGTTIISSGLTIYETNLTTYDLADLQTVRQLEEMIFYANYTESSSPITDGTCLLRQDFNEWAATSYSPLKPMTYNATSGLYEYTTKIIFAGTENYQVQCTHPSYIDMNVTNTSTISTKSWSYNGSGIPADPYEIDTCEELQLMYTEANTDEFELVGDVDCSDTYNWDNGRGYESQYVNGADQYYGDFHGNGYTISNLFINRTEISTFGGNQGIWATIGNNTITNFSIVNASIAGEEHMGVIAGQIFGSLVNITHIQILNATSNFANSNTYHGGLVGLANTDLNVSNVFVNFTCTAYCNRLAGIVAFSSSSVSFTVQDSAIEIYGSGFRTGGMFADVSNLDIVINNSYATGGFPNTGQDAVGGLVAGNPTPGALTVAIYNSFSVMDIDINEANGGVIFGQAYANNGSNNFIDNSTDDDECYDGGSGADCTEINETANPYYFYNSDNAPLSSWDFENIWYEYPNQYPQLRSFASAPICNPQINTQWNVGSIIVCDNEQVFIGLGFVKIKTIGELFLYDSNVTADRFVIESGNRISITNSKLIIN